MKKTLITLAALALASVAQADTTETINWATATNGSSDATKKTYTLGTTLTYDGTMSWEISGTIKIGSGYYSNWGTPILAAGGDASSNVQDNGGFQFHLGNGYLSNGDSSTGNADNALRIELNTRNEANHKPIYATTDGTSSGAALTTARNTFDYTLSYNAYTDKLSLSFEYYTATEVDGSIVKTNLLTDNAAWFSSNVADTYSITKLSNGVYGLTGWEATTTVTTKAIPEPATATLSLLALAGLAARRRRK